MKLLFFFGEFQGDASVVLRVWGGEASERKRKKKRCNSLLTSPNVFFFFFFLLFLEKYNPFAIFLFLKYTHCHRCFLLLLLLCAPWRRPGPILQVNKSIDDQRSERHTTISTHSVSLLVKVLGGPVENPHRPKTMEHKVQTQRESSTRLLQC